MIEALVFSWVTLPCFFFSTFIWGLALYQISFAKKWEFRVSWRQQMVLRVQVLLRGYGVLVPFELMVMQLGGLNKFEVTSSYVNFYGHVLVFGESRSLRLTQSIILETAALKITEGQCIRYQCWVQGRLLEPELFEPIPGKFKPENFQDRNNDTPDVEQLIIYLHGRSTQKYLHHASKIELFTSQLSHTAQC